MTLNQSQGQQTYNENIDPKQDHNHAKCERSHFNSVKTKGNINVFSNENMLIISLEHVQNSKDTVVALKYNQGHWKWYE